VFTREAIDLIHQCSRGIPRTISVICDNALVSGFAGDERPIGWETVFEVCNDFDLDPQKRRPRQSHASVSVGASVAVESRPERSVESGSAAKTLSMAGGDGLFSSFTRRRGFSFF